MADTLPEAEARAEAALDQLRRRGLSFGTGRRHTQQEPETVALFHVFAMLDDDGGTRRIRASRCAFRRWLGVPVQDR